MENLHSFLFYFFVVLLAGVIPGQQKNKNKKEEEEKEMIGDIIVWSLFAQYSNLRVFFGRY